MAIIGECRGWDEETVMLSHWHTCRVRQHREEHTDLFPMIPTQSRFNRRRRNLMYAFNFTRRAVLQVLDVAQERVCVIDSLPVPVVQFYLVPSSTGDTDAVCTALCWAAYGARFGKVSSKKETIFGFPVQYTGLRKLHLLITLAGVILDFELAPANVTDLAVGCELLAEHTDLTALGDTLVAPDRVVKAYISAEKAAELSRDPGPTGRGGAPSCKPSRVVTSVTKSQPRRGGRSIPPARSSKRSTVN